MTGPTLHHHNHIMKAIRLYSLSLWGIDAYPVSIEVDLSGGLPGMVIVGLPDQAIKEARERVRSAIKNSGFPIPSRKFVISLAPADRKKEGPSFDLPIAIGMLSCLEEIPKERLPEYFFLGELALDGQLLPVPGIVSAALTCRKEKRDLIIPAANAAQASVVADSCKILIARNLEEVVRHLQGLSPLPQLEASQIPAKISKEHPDFSDVKGQAGVKRAIEVAVAGGHNLLMIGSPGTGKSMLAKRIPGLLPPLSKAEAREVLRVYSSLPYASEREFAFQRPFRSPHHTVSLAGFAGGGPIPRPGELSMAHHGVLFLDELPEFRKDVLESLRSPLEDGELTISRARGSLRFPAKIMLVAAMNPCNCGLLLDPKRSCTCSLDQIIRYRNRVSGPLLDRMDIQVEVMPIPFSSLSDETKAEASAKILERIITAREIQSRRLKGVTAAVNSALSDPQIREHCQAGTAGKKLLQEAMKQMTFSGRAYMRILKISRTISDLAGSVEIQPEHIAEAIQYRSLDF